jgi:hypothetical protein
MKENFKFNYRNEGSSCYLTVIPETQVKLVPYQLKMLENNDIPHLLPLSMTERNGVKEMFYEVTSSITLKEILSHKKMEKSEFLSLLYSIILLCKELPEYQLSVGCVLLDPEYIFVRPGDFFVSYLYIPDNTESHNIEPVRHFLSDLIMHSSVEVSADSFIPSLLELLNHRDLSVQNLEDFYDEYASVSKRSNVQRSEINSKNDAGRAVPPKSQYDQASVNRIPYSFEESKGVQEDYEPDMEASKKETSVEKSGKNTLKRIIFIILQGVIVICLGYLAGTGLFFDEDGALSATNIAGAVVVWAGIDFILYRKLLSGNKDDTKSEKKPAKAKKSKKSSGSKKTMPKKPEVIKRKAVSDAPERPDPQPAPVKPVDIPVSMPERHVQVQPQYRNVQPIFEEYEDSAYDETVAMGIPAAQGPCLAYYNNGLLTRIPFKGDRILAGRQKNQVDLLLPSARVGHIHAEFRREGDKFVVIDCNSKNGTYINGSSERLNSHTPYSIKNGDVIRLADTEIKFEC